MAITHSFPSEAFPAFPRLGLESPDGWVSLAAVGLPLAVAKEVPAGQFRPNVLVTTTRVGAGHTFEKSVKDLEARLKGLPRFREEARESESGEGAESLWIEGRFSGGRGEIVHQVVKVMVINRGFVYDVVEITGTCSALTGDNGKEEIRRIVRSVTVDCD